MNILIKNTAFVSDITFIHLYHVKECFYYFWYDFWVTKVAFDKTAAIISGIIVSEV